MTTEEYIQKAKAIHGDKYDYSKVEYITNKDKVCIICPEHGEFWQRAGNHIRGVGCPKCGIIKGSSAQKIWTREKCYETARQYKELHAFAEEWPAVYAIAHRNGWIKDYVWLERRQLPNGYWTKELVMAEARKFTSAHEFLAGNSKAYGAARRYGWIKECTWFVKPKKCSSMEL